MRNLFTFYIFVTLMACNFIELDRKKSDNLPENKIAYRIKQIPVDYTRKIDSLQKKILSDASVSHNKFFFIDMKTKSNRKRFFVIDIANKTIIDSGMVAQGINSRTNQNGRIRFSNEINSNCTSLGTYKIGQKYCGKFGIAYKLHGLDKSNSNAYVRAIVLHSYTKIPDEEQIVPICYSLGCPMVSKKFFKKLETIIDNEEKPLTLTILY